MTDVDRQTQLAREHRERQAQRDKNTGTSKRNTIIGVVAGVVVVVGGVIAATTLMGGKDDDKPVAAATPSASVSASVSAPAALPSTSAEPGKAAAVTCAYRKDDSGSPAKKVGMPPAKPDMKAKFMTLDTNQGKIVIELATQQAPCTVNSFEFLAKKNYFDNTHCHRLATVDTTGLGMLQCGDPLAKADGKTEADGTGGPGYLFDDENLGGLPYTRGTVAMAQASEDANSNGSQFWISFSDENTQLSQGAAFTPFGVVKEGMDIVDKISKGGIIPFKGDPLNDVRGVGSNAPKIPVIIKNVTVTR